MFFVEVLGFLKEGSVLFVIEIDLGEEFDELSIGHVLHLNEFLRSLYCKEMNSLREIDQQIFV